MAFRTVARSVAAPLVAAALAVSAVSAQPQLSLEEASARSGADFAPAWENRDVTVRGVVSTRVIPVLDYAHIGIQDDDHFGLLLKSSPESLRALEPGHRIMLRGTIVKHAGMPVLVPNQVEILGKNAAPSPLRVRVEDLIGFRYLGVLVRTDADVVLAGENSGGQVVAIGDTEEPLKVFLPNQARGTPGEFVNGDRVRATGIAMQYCPQPPHNRHFQLLIDGPSAIRMIEPRWLVPPAALLGALTVLLAALATWWLRERRMAAQRDTIRALNVLSEEILGAESPADIAARLETVLPGIWKLSSVHLYAYNGGARILERVRTKSGAQPLAVPLESAKGCVAGGVALCFRNRTLLHVPDTRRSPFYSPSEEPKPPRSILFVPAFSQDEVLAVLQMESDRETRPFSRDEQAAAQHLGNLVAVSLRLQEQLSVREHLFRGERVAASGQLIWSIASDLGAPLEAIATLATNLDPAQGHAAWERDLFALRVEALRASEIVARMATLAKPQKAAAEPLDICVLMRETLAMREREHALGGIVVHDQLPEQPLEVLGSKEQLRQVALNLMLHAENSVRDSTDRTIFVDAHEKGRRAVVEISFGAELKPAGQSDSGSAAEGTALGLPICQGIVQNHGGALRVLRPKLSRTTLEIELPAPRKDPAVEGVADPGKAPAQQLTALVVEPDPESQRKLVRMLDGRGHRAVPVSSSDEAVDMAERLRFDLTLCSMQVESLNWVQYFQRVRNHVGTFVLLTDGFDPDLARIFDGGGGYLLKKPVEDADLDRLIESIEASAGTQAVAGNG